MSKYKKIWLTIFLAVSASTLIAQVKVNNDLVKGIDTLLNKGLTSLQTDVLPKVFSSAINNGIISSSGTTLKLNTTIFGLKKLFKPSVAVDTNYIHETFNRNFAFGSGISIDANNKINGVNGFIKWAIINNRDVSLLDGNHVPKFVLEKELKLEGDIESLVVELGTKIAEPLQDAHGHTRNGVTTPKTITDDEYNQLLNALAKFTTDKNLKNLKQAFVPFKDKIKIDTTIFSGFNQRQFSFVDSAAAAIENEVKKRAIFTVSAETNYQNKSWDSIYFKAEYLKGLGWEKDSTKPWDIYAGAFYNIKADTQTKKALQRQIFTLKVGLNKVFAKRADGGPLFEMLGAAQLDNIVRGYPGEKQHILAADFTFTVKVSNAVSIPFEVKYDPTGRGNLFGYLKVKWDILTSKPGKG